MENETKKLEEVISLHERDIQRIQTDLNEISATVTEIKEKNDYREQLEKIYKELRKLQKSKKRKAKIEIAGYVATGAAITLIITIIWIINI